MTVSHSQPSIACLGTPDVIWAVPSIHGDLDQLIRLHDHIFSKFKVGDRLVYLGNNIGYGAQSAACIDEILTFRRLLLSLPGMKCSDLVYLRGSQEDMWDKLLQIPFAPNPTDTLLWMLGNGLSGTLRSYGLSEHDGIDACRSGTVGLTKWTGKIRAAVRQHAGHETFFTQLARASHTDITQDYPLLFVNAGVDYALPLDQQRDQFWWMGSQFEHIVDPYLPFQKVVRGYDPKHRGYAMNCVTATIDDSCGFGGPLLSVAFAADGSVYDLLEA